MRKQAFLAAEILGWPKKLIQVFLYDVTEKFKQTFWPTQYILSKYVELLEGRCSRWFPKVKTLLWVPGDKRCIMGGPTLVTLVGVEQIQWPGSLKLTALGGRGGGQSTALCWL